MIKTPRVAVLGAGIMGSSAALFLARRGAAITLFDSSNKPISAASRWNEGKIHLGFLYSADQSLKTARQILPGGLAFKSLLESLTGCSLSSATTLTDDIYLCHRMSVVPPDAMQDYFQQVARMVRQHPDASGYLVDVSDCQAEKLTSDELGSISDSRDIVAGFRIPERSVSTTWIADRVIDALSAEERIEQHMSTRVTAVRPQIANEVDGNWLVQSPNGIHGPYDFIINSLWEGRIAIDITAGLTPVGNWSNRFRLSLFLHTTEPVDVPSAVIAVGPFGDIKNYNNRDFYLSWYPKGLILESTAVLPPPPLLLDESHTQEICCSILEKLEELLPWASRIGERIERMTLEGGWVFAAGQGALSDPKSTLHRRSDFGILRLGSYISVDTGKYSTAPWLARKIADSII
jgi:hypothetical protein